MQDQADSWQDWVKAILIWSFLLFWGFGMFTGFTNGACRDADRPAESRLRLCERGEALGWALFTSPQKASALRQRAIVLAKLNRSEEARAVFDQSLKWLPHHGRSREHALQEVRRELAAPDVPPLARSLWRAALATQ